MKPSDLMIGDWVHCPKLDYAPENYVANMQVKQLHVADLDTYSFKELKYEEIDPIPLTAKILEKNGFVSNKHVYPYPYYEYESKDNKLKIGFAFPQGNKTVYKDPWIYIDSENILIEHLPCMFVHKLQNILRLCDIEKEIAL